MATKMTREEVIKIVQSATVWTDEERDALAMLIPELAESEDERIRKALIEVFKKKLERGFEWVEYGIPNRSVLDWLEKQKEASKAIEAVERIDKYIDENVANAHDMKNSNPDKKYYRGWDDALGKMAGILQDVYSDEKQKEQKKEKFPPYVTGFKGHPDPAGTSDLEEAAKEYASKTLCDPDDGPSTGLAKESFIAGAEWQKEQKSAEWSEEDEKDMAHIIRILDDCYVYGTHDLSKTDHENLVNKLKSLRPSWKPSEEQMKALNEIVNILAASPFLHQNDYLFNILNGLREELKKLL